MDTTVQKCSGEVKQTPDCPLKRTQKNNLQPWRVVVATQFYGHSLKKDINGRK